MVNDFENILLRKWTLYIWGYDIEIEDEYMSNAQCCNLVQKGAVQCLIWVSCEEQWGTSLFLLDDQVAVDEIEEKSQQPVSLQVYLLI